MLEKGAAWVVFDSAVEGSGDLIISFNNGWERRHKPAKRKAMVRQRFQLLLKSPLETMFTQKNWRRGTGLWTNVFWALHRHQHLEQKLQIWKNHRLCFVRSSQYTSEHLTLMTSKQRFRLEIWMYSFLVSFPQPAAYLDDVSQFLNSTRLQEYSRLCGSKWDKLILSGTRWVLSGGDDEAKVYRCHWALIRRYIATKALKKQNHSRLTCCQVPADLLQRFVDLSLALVVQMGSSQQFINKPRKRESGKVWLCCSLLFQRLARTG